MKMTKKLLSLLLCFVLVAQLCIPVFAAGGETNLSYEITKTTAKVGDQITLTINNCDMTIQGIIAGFVFDKEKLQVNKITWKAITAYDEENEEDADNVATSKASKKNANETGIARGVYAINSGVDSECYEGTIVTVIFDVIATGDAVITLTEETAGTDAFKSDNVATITVSIKAASTCTHPATGAEPNGDGTHNIVCADENCGEIVMENVPCTEDTRKESVSEADCDTAATFVDVTFCTECGAELGRGTPYTEGSALGHTWGTVAYSWNSDNSACEAVRECTVDGCGVKETAEAEVSSSTTPATCENPEKVVYTATFAEDWAETQTIEVNGTVTLAHEYFYECDAFCMNCGELTNPDAAHSLTHVAAKAGTDCQTWDGNIEYWTCEYCGGCWDNANATGAPLNAMTIKVAGPHSYAYECDGYCQICYELTNPDAAHDLTHVPAKAGTDCQTWDGNIEYWTCEHCGVCWDNANATGMPLNAMTVKVAGPHSYFYECDGYCQTCGELTNEDAAHNLTHVPAKAGTDCQTWDGNIEYWTCSHCGGCWDNANATGFPMNQMMVKAAGPHSYFYECDAYCEVCFELTNPDAAHELTHVPAKAGTDCQTWDGNIEYWTCEHCGVCWDNANATGAPLSQMTIKVAGDHSYFYECDAYCQTCGELTNPDAAHSLTHVEAKAGTDCQTWDGNIEYWTCEHCGVCWDNANATGMPLNAMTIKVAGDHHTVAVDNGDGTHKRFCDVENCGEVFAAAEEHDYTHDAAAHKCICGKVEEFTLNIFAMAFSGEEHYQFPIEVSVPYGAKIADYIPADGGDSNDYAPVYSVGQEVPVSGTVYEGTFTAKGWMWYSVEDSCNYPLDMETATMPDHALDISQGFSFTGWEHYHSQGTMYSQNGDCLAGWNEIDGNWYYFDPATNYRAEGLSRVPYPVDNNGDPMEVDGNIYAPNAEDLAYAGFIDAEEGWFLFGSDGKFQSGVTGKGTYNGATRWVENGHIAWHPGMVKVDGNYYYFLGDEELGGNILAVETLTEEDKNLNDEYDIYVTRANNASLDREFNEGWYTFYDWGGLSTVYGFCGYANWTKIRLYGTDGADKHRLMCGLGLYKWTSDTYIYVRSNGEVVADQDFWVGENKLGVVPGIYTFDENGYMVNPVSTSKNGVYWENNGWFLYENGKLVRNKGLIEISTVWHDGEGDLEMSGIVYVRSNGQLATNYYYVTNVANYTGATPVAVGSKLFFGNFGIASPIKNGFVQENDSIYYYVNNALAYNAGVIQVGGNYYYVRSNGEVVNNRSYYVTNVGSTGVLAKSYTFNEKGVMQNPLFGTQNGIKNGYYYVNGKIAYGAGVVEIEEGVYIYVRSNGKIATGLYWITNTNGELAQGQYDFGTDGKYYA